ncbi:hypothetical protein [Kribbella sp. VKM Ac-2568]|uniref:hypothetical protein n=1 Tax=Kribbella sp. VKM Ac-2568 TaxID=2512219 RepID=UPI001042F565|nr:hypothetical protein [Kribbella sp. VKM Ac-2568]TCM33810.1 hypothetical protein EV648_1295 [Kribbella sp. VKM Ac-2568]
MAHAKRVGSAIVGLALATSLVACESDDTGTDSGDTSQGAGGGKGGTVTVYSINDVEHLDPGRNFATDAGMIGKLITRTLTDYRYDAKSKKIVLGNDLAESYESSPDLKTWTFKLRTENLLLLDPTHNLRWPCDPRRTHNHQSAPPPTKLSPTPRPAKWLAPQRRSHRLAPSRTSEPDHGKI